HNECKVNNKYRNSADFVYFQKEMMVSPDFERPRSPRSFSHAMESRLRSCGDLQVSLRRIGICLSIWGLWGNFFGGLFAVCQKKFVYLAALYAQINQ
ncbi:MAG: hypothetical protein K2M09_08625, partial [Muribaculaceae bacterium]|nr:hypothetical protein [Muribaculaceae bacterium]